MFHAVGLAKYLQNGKNSLREIVFYLVKANPRKQTKEGVFQRCSVKGVLRNFTKFIGKHLCQSLFLIKVGDSDTGFFL